MFSFATQSYLRDQLMEHGNLGGYDKATHCIDIDPFRLTEASVRLFLTPDYPIWPKVYARHTIA
jgi:hypothetical protein